MKSKLRCGTVFRAGRALSVILCVAPITTLMPKSTMAAAEPTLTQASIAFETTTDDKDHDSGLSVFLYDQRGTLVGKKLQILGHWQDHTTHEIPLDSIVHPGRSDLGSGRVRLEIRTNGHDRWMFHYTLRLTYSDGKVIEHAWKDKRLDEEANSTEDTWKGDR